MDRRRLLLTAFATAAVGSPMRALASQPPAAGASSQVSLRALHVNVRRANGRWGILTCDVGLDVPDAGLRTRAQALAPRLVADFNALLGTYAAGLRPGEPPDPDAIAVRFQRALDGLLRARGARVLILGLVHG